MSLERAIKNILSVKTDNDLIYKFAYERFIEKFDSNYKGIYYRGFEIISKDIIHVKYEYHFQDYFIVDMKEYIREDKLINILNYEKN